jgi:ceramide glucosyltransferase
LPTSLLTLGEFVTFAASLAGIGYYLVCLWAARDYRRSAPHHEVTPFSPPISILKPLKGEDPEIYESFRSHCLQKYPKYELIFGVSDPVDPAVRAVERLRREFPEHAIQLVVCSENLGANAKVSNLVQMTRSASYDHFIVSDSDIRVSADYLRRVIGPLANSRVGVVTCLYRGVAGPTLGSKLEALGISTDFLAGVLVARLIEGGMRFALGSTMAFRRDDLRAIGGFESIVDYLADDYELGKRIAGLGREVVISEEVVDTFLPAYALGQFVDHQLRWARGVRAARPGGYLGLLFTFGWQWAALAVLVSRGASWCWGLLALAASLRALVAWSVGWRVLKDQKVLRLFPILPLRDLVAPLVWVASFASNTVTWRGDRFTVNGGKLTRTNSR